MAGAEPCRRHTPADLDKVRGVVIALMSEIRVGLLSSLICLILVACLMVRIETLLRSPEVPGDREDADIE
ncbi:MAG: hypothetical protein ACI89X_004929 [Planctomycetota bacterium]|jgi:hypothetical protein